jgi:hypothetical protein
MEKIPKEGNGVEKPSFEVDKEKIDESLCGDPLLF